LITSDESDFTDATPFEIQITFSSAVTGFVVGDIAITNATLSNFAGSGASYTADVTPDLVDDIEIKVLANVTVEGNSASNVVSITAPIRGSFSEGNQRYKVDDGGKWVKFRGVDLYDTSSSDLVYFEIEYTGTITPNWYGGITWFTGGAPDFDGNYVHLRSNYTFTYSSISGNNPTGFPTATASNDYIIRVWIKGRKIWFGYKTDSASGYTGNPSLDTGENYSDLPLSTVIYPSSKNYSTNEGCRILSKSSNIKSDALGATPLGGS
jgi:hypothetical protein